MKTLRFRVKDKHTVTLDKWAREVNAIWNAANELSAEYSLVPIPGVGYISCKTSEFDLNTELKYIRKEKNFAIGAVTVQSVIGQHARSRRQFKRDKLAWRTSSGLKRSLGWVPVKTSSFKIVGHKVKVFGVLFDLWDTYDITKYNIKTGSFAEDSRGRWYLNVTVEGQSEKSKSTVAVGVDLGLKTTATCSDGVTLARRRFSAEFEEALSIARKARKRKRIKAIQAKIKNSRKDTIHKFTTSMVQNYGAIFVGDVSSKKLIKTKLAKSVLDAGWGMLKTQLKYKAIARSVVYVEVAEKYTTQTCSGCGVISLNSPKGRAGLAIREWTCPECGERHDRDVNAAKNILRLGCQSLEAGAC